MRPARRALVVAGLTVVALACLGAGMALFADDEDAPLPGLDSPVAPAGDRGDGAATPPAELGPGERTANCRRRALGPGDLEAAGRRDFAPRCVERQRASAGGSRASP